MFSYLKEVNIYLVYKKVSLNLKKLRKTTAPTILYGSFGGFQLVLPNSYTIGKRKISSQIYQNKRTTAV